MCAESSGPSADLWCVLFCVSAGCQTVWSQRKAVLLWSQLWTPTPPIWESWTWVTTTCRIQEWSDFLLNWRVHTVSLKLSGQDSLFYFIISSNCTIGAGLNQTLKRQWKNISHMSEDHQNNYISYWWKHECILYKMCVHQSFLHFGPDLLISTTTGWIVKRFGSDIPAPLRMNCHYFGDTLTFLLAPSPGHHFIPYNMLVHDQIFAKVMAFPSASVIICV